MIEELNKILISEDIALNQFDERGFSINAFVTEVFFLFCDVKHQVVRMYTNVMRVDPYYKEQSAVLLALLKLNGPQALYPELKVGFDLNSDYLWLSKALPFSACSSGVAFKEQVNNFRQSASAAKELVIKDFDEAIAQEQPRSAPSIVNVSQAAAPAAKAPQDTDELVKLMTNTQMFWG